MNATMDSLNSMRRIHADIDVSAHMPIWIHIICPGGNKPKRPESPRSIWPTTWPT